MGYTIPNAGDTGGGFKWVNINQAEPDSVDFESLGQSDTYIRSGGVVSYVSSSTVSVTAGTAIIAGQVYPFSAPANITCTSISLQFDLIVARLSGSTVTVVRVSGDVVASATNPILPKSNNSIVSGATGSTNYYPATDALLAAIYVPSGGLTAQSNIVDKRRISLLPVVASSTSVWSASPANNASYVTGDQVVDSNNDLWFKSSGGTWYALSRDGGTPGGTIVAIAKSTAPTGWASLDGSTIASAQSLYVNTWANTPASWHSGTSLVLPDARNASMIGQSYGTLGALAGANTVTISANNLPTHTHPVSITDPQHNHATPATYQSCNVYQGGHTHDIQRGTVEAYAYPNGSGIFNLVHSSGTDVVTSEYQNSTDWIGADFTLPAMTTTTKGTGISASATANTTTATAITTVPSSVVINWIIKLS